MGGQHSPLVTRLAGTITADLVDHGHDVTDDEAHQLAHDLVEQLTMLRLVESSSLAGTKPNIGGDVIRTRLGHYISTGCLHLRHQSCRRRCKFCDRLCRCPCHHGQDPPPPHSSQATLIAGSTRLINLYLDEALAITRYFLYRGDRVHLELQEDGGVAPLAVDPHGDHPPGL